MNHIKELRPFYTFVSLPYDITKSTLALFISEILYKSLKEETANTAQFDFLYRVITFLDQTQNPAITANLHLWFMLKFTQYLGFYPRNNFFYTDRPYFDLAEGEFCHRQPNHNHYIQLPLSSFFFTLMQLNSDQTDQLHLTKLQRRQLLHALVAYYKYHLEGFEEVKSLQILEDIFDN